LLTGFAVGKDTTVPFLLLLQSLAKTIPSTQLWLQPSICCFLLVWQVLHAGFIAASPQISNKEDHTHFPVNQRLFLGEGESLYVIILSSWSEVEAAMSVDGE
jgi:hypothetical protein